MTKDIGTDASPKTEIQHFDIADRSLVRCTEPSRKLACCMCIAAALVYMFVFRCFAHQPASSAHAHARETG